MANIFFFGDSMTFGAWDEKGGWADRAKNDMQNKIISSHFSYYHHVYQLGVPGDTTTMLLKRFEQEIKSRLLGEVDNNGVIILGIGLNDSKTYKDTAKGNIVQYDDFLNNLHLLLQSAQKYASKIMFVGLTPVDEPKVNLIPWFAETPYRNNMIAKYNDGLKKFCKTQDLTFVDLFDEWIDRDYKKLLIDGLHPNTDGHEKIYHKVKQALEKSKI